MKDPNAPPVDSALDALLAKIHGLAGSSAPSTLESSEGANSDSAISRGHLAPASGVSSESVGSEIRPTDRLADESRSVAPTGFRPSRDEPWRPPEPQSLSDLKVGEMLVEQIVLRFLLASGEALGRQIASQVKLPFGLIEPILTRLRAELKITYRGGTAAGDYLYVLTESGRSIARSYAVECTYYGACPVSLQDYIQSVRQQSVEGQHPQKEDLDRAFADLLVSSSMLARLGPAINSGKGMFLYGYPGNGKTSIAERVTATFGETIWIPRAIEVDGEILRLYDRMVHVDCDLPRESDSYLRQAGFDQRWVRIKRPTVVVGGELELSMLEVQRNHSTGTSEAPLQMKSNCGTLVIDDFGRQKISVSQLLNRWIVPLEKRHDYLNMHSGKKIQVPFDQLVVFSTNLEPKDLVDDAFLRRIPYKIEVPNPSEEHFRKLFEIMCRVTGIPYRSEPIEYLIQTHYRPVGRPFRNCQPRDLLLQIKAHCHYQGIPLELRNEYFDIAVENYFSIM